MRLINFGKVDKKFLIPIFGGITIFTYKYIYSLLPKNKILSKNPFIANILFSIGMIFAFIPYFILKFRSKKSSNNIDLNKSLEQQKSKLNIELIYEEDSPENMTSKKYLYILIGSLFDYFQTLLLNIFCYNCVYNLWIFDIIFISIFSFLMLKKKLYKHQYISMIIIIILGFGLNIIEYFKFGQDENKINLFEIFLKLLSEISMSIIVVISKYNMEKTYCSPYEICIWEGFFGLILHIITLVIINNIGATIADIKYPENFFEYFDNYDIYDFILCIVVIIVAFVYNVSIFLICDYFTPFHILITSIIKECHTYIQKDNNLTLNILGIVILILIAFMFLIFIEIIELNVFNISYNTKKNIDIRAKSEILIDMDYITTPKEEINDDE